MLRFNNSGHGRDINNSMTTALDIHTCYSFVNNRNLNNVVSSEAYIMLTPLLWPQWLPLKTASQFESHGSQGYCKELAAFWENCM